MPALFEILLPSFSQLGEDTAIQMKIAVPADLLPPKPVAAPQILARTLLRQAGFGFCGGVLRSG